MHIGLKYQGMKSMIMIIRELIPIIGFPKRGDNSSEITTANNLNETIRKNVLLKQVRAEFGQAQPYSRTGGT